MPNLKSISFKLALLQGGGQIPCVCYPKDPMWNRVKKLKKKKGAGMGELSNEIPNLILMLLTLLSKDAILHKVGAEVYK